jgi:FAD/FMN-containing dehydrogenase
MPRAVLTPASSADIAAAVRSAPTQKLQVAARGQGHSTYGRCMVADGIIIDMRRLNTIDEIDAGRVVVGAGATWKSVLEATLVQGLTPPVLTNYLNLSVGGTLAVGGIGGTSSRFGMQTDQVLELDVVTGDGRELKCSRDSNPDLFEAMRGGLAQCGIVTRATLALTRAPDRVRRYQLFYPDLPRWLPISGAYWPTTVLTSCRARSFPTERVPGTTSSRAPSTIAVIQFPMTARFLRICRINAAPPSSPI